MSAPDLAWHIVDALTDKFDLDWEEAQEVIRATLAASAELRSVEEALEVMRTSNNKHGQWVDGDEKVAMAAAALSALRAITGRKA